MSINYHAYQCRGYLLSDYEEIYKQWKTAFTDYDPERVVSILDLVKDEQYLYLIYWDTLFRLDLKEGTLEKKLPLESWIQEEVRDRLKDMEARNYDAARLMEQKEQLLADKNLADTVKKIWQKQEGWTDRVYFNEGMVIYHLLSFVKDKPGLSGKWIPNTNLDPRATRDQKREDLLQQDFCRKVTGRLEELEDACVQFGGREIPTKADCAYQFQVFPQIALQLHYYDEDDEFPAQVQILVDSRITDYVHLETTGCMVSDLFEKLTNLM